VYQNPSQHQFESEDGLPLAHYAANQWLLHRNSSVRMKDLDAGGSQTLLVGDAYGDFPPFGSPYNWRDPLIPINTSPGAFGYSQYGMQILLADGSTKWINTSLADEVGASFAGPEALQPTAEQVAKPPGEYRLKSHKMWKTVVLYSDGSSDWQLKARKNPAGELVSAWFQSWDKGPSLPKRPLDEALKSLEAHVLLEWFDGHSCVSDVGLQVLAGFPNLRSLSIGGEWITDAGLESIAQINSLRELQIYRPLKTQITDGGIARLRAQMPQTKIEANDAGQWQRSAPSRFAVPRPPADATRPANGNN
jgi:hypothetical protein